MALLIAHDTIKINMIAPRTIVPAVDPVADLMITRYGCPMGESIKWLESSMQNIKVTLTDGLVSRNTIG